MNSNPYVSIIVPVFNGGNPFHSCVSSLMEIAYPNHKFKVILVNDGSTDNTGNWLYKQKLLTNFEIITHAKNNGRAAARNSGLKNVKGDIIIFLDADMIVKPDFIKQHVKVLSKSEVVAASGLLLSNPKQPRTSLQDYLFEYRRRGAKQFGENIPIPFNYLITGNLSVTRRAVDECGVFDESYVGYGGEDTDYAIRLWELYPEGLRFSSKAVSIHCHDESLGDLETKIRKYGSTNYLRLLNKYPKYANSLAGDWINSIKGYLIFNQAVKWIVTTILYIVPFPYFLRYLIAYSLIVGARNPEEGVPKFRSK